MESSRFIELLQKMRTGDDEAAELLFREYEPHVRRVIRIRLRNIGIRRLADSVDVCQSVFATFFIRANAGEYSIDSPDELLRLLGTIARNRVSNLVKHEQAQKRDVRRLDKHDVGEHSVTADRHSVGSIVAGREILRAFYDRLDDRNREIAELRNSGNTWREIAQQLSGNEDQIRISFSRAMNLAIEQLDNGRD